MKLPDSPGRIFASPESSGVYYAAGKLTDIERAAKAAGLSVVKIDVGREAGKIEFLNSVAKRLKFPKHFGQNWDALHDLLTDLSWHKTKGWVVVLVNMRSFAERHKEHFETAVQVLKAAAEHWRNQGKPFWVLVQGEKDWDPGLPKLTEG